MERRCLLTDYRPSANALTAIIGLEILLRTVTATSTTTTAAGANGVVEEVSCFNTIFSVSCAPNRAIVFDSARYGRNDSHLAARCGVPFSRHCDVDVHFLMNRACSGRRKCNVMVNTALFGDPCGYEEFLRITYQCIPVLAVHNTCFSAFSPTVYNHGYLSTPNYPDKYFMDADCTWRLAVQSHQTIRITIFDFELDLKRAGSCKDFLEISADGRSYFKDCGILGKQVVEVNASSATVQFVTGQSSLTQRGFFLYFEGVGPGCPNLKSASYGVFIVHFLDGHQILSANVSCWEGLVFSGGLDATSLLLKCVDTAWTREIPDCVEPDTIHPTTVRRLTAPVTRTITNPASEHGQSNRISSLSKSASVIGFALGVISSVFFVVLLVLIIVYCYMRRKNRNSGRNVDKWRVVINNLQENATKQEHTTYKHFTADDSISNIVRTSAYCSGSNSSSRRPPAASNRSIPTSFRSIQAQHGCSALAEGSAAAADSSEKRNRPTWIEVAQPYSPATECTCYGTAAAVAKYSSGRSDAESVNIGAAIRRTCPGAGCRYVGRSRQTISPCCSHWGTVRSSCQSPVAEAAAAVDVERSTAEADLSNSPDFAFSRHSAPDLFTITARSGANNQLSVEGRGGVGGSRDDLPSENETLLNSPDDSRWLQRDNQALSPVSTTRQLFPVNDSSILMANALKPYDKRMG